MYNLSHSILKSVSTFYFGSKLPNHSRYIRDVTIVQRIDVHFLTITSSLKAQEFSDALHWYNSSLSLYTSADANDSNLSKLHRNRASCLLALDRLDEARSQLKARLVFVVFPYKYAVLIGRQRKRRRKRKRWIGTRDTPTS